LKAFPSLRTLQFPIAHLGQEIYRHHLPRHTAPVATPCLGAYAEAGKTRSDSLLTNAPAIHPIHHAAEDSFSTIDH
jgi:hypothetical protein